MMFSITVSSEQFAVPASFASELTFRPSQVTSWNGSGIGLGRPDWLSLT